MMQTVGDLRVETYGFTAVHMTRLDNRGNFRQRLIADEWTSDSFVYRGTGWKCVLSHVKPSVDQGVSDAG